MKGGLRVWQEFTTASLKAKKSTAQIVARQQSTTMMESFVAMKTVKTVRSYRPETMEND